MILSHRSSSGQKVSSPNDQNEQSFELLPDGHIRAMEESKMIRNSNRDRSGTMLSGNAREHTIQTNRRQRLDDMDRSTCSLAHSLVSEVPMCSPRSFVPWAGRVEENWWSWAKQFLHIFQRLERDLETPHRTWPTDGQSGVWLGTSDLTDEHFARTDDGVVYARNVRRRAEHSWSEENLKSVIETPRKPRSTTTDDAADPRAVTEVHEHEKQEAKRQHGGDGPDDEDLDMEEEETLPEPDTTAASSSSRGEKRTGTKEHVFVKRRLMIKSPMRPITLVPEDLVKRRLLKKTYMRNDTSVMNVDENLFKVVNTHEGREHA